MSSTKTCVATRSLSGAIQYQVTVYQASSSTCSFSLQVCQSNLVSCTANSLWYTTNEINNYKLVTNILTDSTTLADLGGLKLTTDSTMCPSTEAFNFNRIYVTKRGTGASYSYVCYDTTASFCQVKMSMTQNPLQLSSPSYANPYFIAYSSTGTMKYTYSVVMRLQSDVPNCISTSMAVIDTDDSPVTMYGTVLFKPAAITSFFAGKYYTFVFRLNQDMMNSFTNVNIQPLVTCSGFVLNQFMIWDISDTKLYSFSSSTYTASISESQLASTTLQAGSGSQGQSYNLQLTTVGDVVHTVDAPLTIDIIGTTSSFIAELDAVTYPAFVPTIVTLYHPIAVGNIVSVTLYRYGTYSECNNKLIQLADLTTGKNYAATLTCTQTNASFATYAVSGTMVTTVTPTSKNTATTNSQNIGSTSTIKTVALTTVPVSSTRLTTVTTTATSTTMNTVTTNSQDIGSPSTMETVALTTVPVSSTRLMCPSPPVMANATVPLPVSRLLGSMVTYSCREGYTFPDGSRNKTISCVDYTWQPAINDCVVIQCPNLDIPNAYIDRVTTDRGYVAYVRCYTGSVMPDGTRLRTLLCAETGLWHTTGITCNPIGCSDLPSRFHQYADWFAVNSHVAMTTLNITCHIDAAMAIGQQSYGMVACSTSGRWSAMNDLCRVTKRCQVPAYVSHAVAVVNYDSNTVSYRCTRGYRFHHGDVIQNVSLCTTSDDVIDAIRCYDVTCSSSMTLSNAVKNTSLALHGTVVEYQCSAGYAFTIDNVDQNVTTTRLTNTTTITCQDDGNWTTISSNCRVIYCPSFINMTSSVSLSTNQHAAYTYLQLTCNIPGHRFVDGRTAIAVTCQEDGTWSDEVSDCAGDRCPFNADIIVNATRSSRMAIVGSLVTFTCLEGHEFKSDQATLTVECLDNLQWNDSTSVACHPVRCPSPASTMSNAVINSTSLSLNNLWQYRSSVEYNCNEGYILADGEHSFRVTCSSDKTWISPSNASSICLRVRCPDPPTTVLRAKITWLSDSNEALYGSISIVHCDSGFRVSGRWTTTGNLPVTKLALACTLTGKWNNTFPDQCVEIRCPPFGSWTGLMSDINETSVGTTVNVTCATNMKFSDGESSTSGYRMSLCDKTGTWSPSLPTCIGTNSVGRLYETIEAPAAVGVGVVMGIVCLACPILFIVLLDLTSVFKAHM